MGYFADVSKLTLGITVSTLLADLTPIIASPTLYILIGYLWQYNEQNTTTITPAILGTATLRSLLAHYGLTTVTLTSSLFTSIPVSILTGGFVALGAALATYTTGSNPHH